ncbi:MAG: hypothetical protein CBC27_03145 [Opitutia bacterium TMED67]|nr:hypothetical protein [Verrucomicrobiales bacterium]OUU73556.1 MAG: hypothetical protein CBC27_03145 [Opitutae bacterium TMED67]|tara:strand:+ start:1569 stop:1988 length:420 start_codon:yes stop_codon:yes gene_type:complete
MIIQLQKNTPPKSGVVLFEVILALVLFSFAAIIIANSFSSSLRSVDRMRNDLDASNLAISTLSEIELGIKPIETSPPTEFEEPFEKWTWQIETTKPNEDLDMGGGLTLVEVIIINEDLGRETRIARMIRSPAEIQFLND